jgi:cell division septum initiation protein DivIVA
MSDLNERLRRYSYRGDKDDEVGQLIHELIEDIHEAADEIERLTARNEELEAKLLEEKDANDHWYNEGKRIGKRAAAQEKP